MVTIPTQAENVSNMNNKGNILILVLVIAASIALGILGYFFWQKQQTEKAQQELLNNGNYSKNITSPKEKGNVEIDTSNWKTYTSLKYGFSLNYPPNSAVLDLEKGVIFSIGNFTSYNVEIFSNELNRTLNDWIQKEETCGNLPRGPGENYKLDGVTGIRIKKIMACSPGGGGLADTIYMNKDENVYRVSRVQSGGEPSSDEINYFDQILSTFKFLDQTAPGMEQKIKTWAGLGVTFNYPSYLSPAEPITNIQKVEAGGFYQQSFNSSQHINVLLKVFPPDKNISPGKITDLSYVALTPDSKSMVLITVFVQPADETNINNGHDLLNQIISSLKFL